MTEHLTRPLIGRKALIAGAARGIGRAIALAAARAGADVALLDLPTPLDAAPLDPALPPGATEDLETLAALITAEGRTAVTVTADVRDHPAMVRAVARAATSSTGSTSSRSTPGSPVGARCWT